MNKLKELLQIGTRYFGSGSYTTPEFDEFFQDFKKSFTRQLRNLGATAIEFHKGHFDLFGFFKVGDQYYYFSLSDVRGGYNYCPQLLVRTAQHNKDFTGGGNNYVPIQNGMYKAIARQFRIELPTTSTKKTKTNEEIAEDIIKKGYVQMYVSSRKRANYIAWRVDEKLRSVGHSSTTITESRLGRTYISARCETEQFTYYYDAQSKRLTIHVLDVEIPEEEFMKLLDVPSKGSMVSNMFVPEQKAFLEPQALALHDFIKGAELTRHPLFSQALHLFRSKYPEEYYTLLD